MSAQYRFVLDARTATMGFPGIGRYVTSLAGAMTPLLTRGESLWILCDPREPSPWQGMGVDSSRVEFVPFPVSPFSARAQWLVPRWLQARGANLYHSPYYVMPYRTGVKSVLTLCDLIPQRMPQAVSPLARFLAPILIRYAANRADHVLAISESTRAILLASQVTLQQKTSVVPLAAAPSFRPQAPGEVERVRRKLQLPRKFLLYLGSNKPHKNLPFLLSAWHRVTERRSVEGFRLLLAGAWDNRYPESKQIAIERDLTRTTRFLGQIAEADLPGLYAAATAFVFPSLEEGFGLPVIEAMACATPVVCSRIPSLMEVARDAALYFDPASVTDLTDRLEHCLRSPSVRKQLCEQGQKEANRYSWSDSARQTLAVYRHIASTRGNG